MKRIFTTITLALALVAPALGLATGNARLKGTYAYEMSVSGAQQFGTLTFDGVGHVKVYNGKTTITYTYAVSGSNGAISDGWLLILTNGNSTGVAQTVRINVSAAPTVGGWASLEN